MKSVSTYGISCGVPFPIPSPNSPPRLIANSACAIWYPCLSITLHGSLHACTRTCTWENIRYASNDAPAPATSPPARYSGWCAEIVIRNTYTIKRINALPRSFDRTRISTCAVAPIPAATTCRIPVFSERTAARKNTNVSLTNSDGWKVIPPIDQDSFEPCVTCPKISTIPRAAIPIPA